MRLKVYFQSWASISVSVAFAVFLLALSACETQEILLEAPQLAEASNWSEVYLKETCASVEVGATCPGQNGFHVDTEGQVSIGPEFGPVEPGSLVSLEELSALLIAANAAAAQVSTSLIWNCEAWVPTPGEPGVLLRIHDERGVSKTIYQKSLPTMQVCYRGEKGVAEALSVAMSPLVARYGVLPTPSPTPTPTPTPTARSFRSW